MHFNNRPGLTRGNGRGNRTPSRGGNIYMPPLPPRPRRRREEVRMGYPGMRERDITRTYSPGRTPGMRGRDITRTYSPGHPGLPKTDITETY